MPKNLHMLYGAAHSCMSPKLIYVLLVLDQHASLSTMKQSFATKAQRMTHTQTAWHAY